MRNLPRVQSKPDDQEIIVYLPQNGRIDTATVIAATRKQNAAISEAVRRARLER